MAATTHISKSRFVAGLQCHKRLWWQVHEPEAPELVPDAATQVIFDRGHRVGERAREDVPGGVLIDLPYEKLEERVAATAKALAERAKVIYEASFLENGVFVTVDILERRRRGFGIVEVKSTLDVKEGHLPDLAIQLAVVRKAGLQVSRAELMHLNRECRFPDLSNLFVRENLTRKATSLALAYPREIRTQQWMLERKLPVISVGDHCYDPYECPFIGRCWPEPPEHHVSTLYRISAKKVRKIEQRGWVTIHDLPEDFEAGETALRQIRSIREDRVVIEPGLAKALRRLRPPLAFLDFETVMPAIPAWPGCSPYKSVPVQLSCHVQGVNGFAHHAWLAEGPGDPREAIALALLEACHGARTILAYNAPFEIGCIEDLAEAVPRLGKRLRAAARRIVDLLAIVRDHVYAPAFGGGFGLKAVLPALVEDLGYEDLEIQDGSTAAALLEGLLLDEGAFDPAERSELRNELLDYCERDTLAMVRLYERLQGLARA